MSNDQQSFRSRRGRFSFSIPSHHHDCMSPDSRVPSPGSQELSELSEVPRVGRTPESPGSCIIRVLSWPGWPGWKLAGPHCSPIAVSDKDLAEETSVQIFLADQIKPYLLADKIVVYLTPSRRIVHRSLATNKTFISFGFRQSKFIIVLSTL